MQSFYIFLKEDRFLEFHEALVNAEIARKISEFCALTCHAILAIVEGSEFTNDYLEMAEAAASSPYELAIIAESLAACDLSQQNPSTAAERCLAILEQICRAEIHGAAWRSGSTACTRWK